VRGTSFRINCCSGYNVVFILRNRDSSVSIATGYELDGRGSIPGRAKFFLFSTASRPALVPTQSAVQWVTEAISLGVNRPGRDADHSPPSSA
jgi:hypothetical protein